MSSPSVNEVENLWNEYYPKVFGYFFRRLNTRQDVEDLVSVVLEVFIDKVTDKDITIKNKNAFLWRIAHNKLVDFIRTKSKNPVVVGFEENWNLIDDKAEITFSTAYKGRIGKLMECIKHSLKSEDYQIVLESICNDKKSPEIAEMLNLTAANVRQKLSRNLKKLRKKCRDIWEGFQPTVE